jgi:hypothetical protein
VKEFFERDDGIERPSHESSLIPVVTPWSKGTAPDPAGRKEQQDHFNLPSPPVSSARGESAFSIQVITSHEEGNVLPHSSNPTGG